MKPSTSACSICPAGKRRKRAPTPTITYLKPARAHSGRSPEMRRLVLESLPSLSPFSIEILLSSTWGEIRDASAQVVPFLKQAVSRQWPQISPSIPGLALLRLSEFDQSAALDLARDALLPATFRLTMRSCWKFRFRPLGNSIKLCCRNTGKGSWWMRELRASPVRI